jgi:hypothetical protein
MSKQANSNSRQSAGSLLTGGKLSDEQLDSMVDPELRRDRREPVIDPATTVTSSGDTASGGAQASATPATSTTSDATASTTQGGQADVLAGLGAEGNGATQTGSDANAQNTTTQTNAQAENTGVQVTDGIIHNADGTQMTSEQVVTLPPNQKIRLDDGTVTDLQTLRASGYFKNEYDNRVRNLNQKEQQVAATQQALDGLKPYIPVLEQSAFARAYMENFRLTGDEGKAAAAAAAATGISLPGAVAPQQASNQPPQPGTDEFYLQSPKDAGVEFGTQEYDEFLLKSAEVRGAHGYRKERQKDLDAQQARDAEQARIQRQSQEEADRQKQLDEHFTNHNTAMLQKMGEVFARERGIDLGKLTLDQRKSLGDAITRTFVNEGLNVTDETWLRNKMLDETHLRYIAKVTPFSLTGAASGNANGNGNTTSQSAPKVVPPTPAAATTTDQVLSAGGQSQAIPTKTGDTPLPETEGQMHRGLMKQLLK